MFCLKARGEDQTSLFEGCGELHPFFLSVCSLPSFEKVKGDSQDLFSLPREKGGLFLPTEGQTELSFFLVKLERPVCLWRRSTLFFLMNLEEALFFFL